MRFFPLIMFMGCEDSGIYQYANIFTNLGIPCGMPYSFLRSSLASRRMPAHEFHSYYTAIRRFFGDLGLPPIAEIPPDRIDSSQFDYFSMLFCRCLLSQLGEKPYLCADHLTTLAMPIVIRALELGDICSRSYLFFSNPVKEASSLLIRYGQPVKLSEFVWRNTIVSSILNWGSNINFIDTDYMTPESFEYLKNDIFSFCGMDHEPINTDLHFPAINNFVSPTGPIKLSSLTMDLYEALRKHIKNKDFVSLNKIASKIHSLQSEQNGWQYVDCLDCGELNSHARLLLNEDPEKSKQDFTCDDEHVLASPQQNDELMNLLDILERKLVDAQNDYASRLFLHTSALNTYCAHKLDDWRALNCLEKKAEKSKYRCKSGRKIHKPHSHRRFKVKSK